MANESYYHAAQNMRSGGNGLDQGSAQDPVRSYYDSSNNMAPGGDQGPKLGATFYPGGQDDFLMPELISPSPQRIMPEVPSNMQEGIEHLELEAREVPQEKLGSVSGVSSSSSQSQSQSQYYEPVSPLQRTAPQLPPLPPPPTSYTAGYGPTVVAPYQTAAQQPQSRAPGRTAAYDHTNGALYQIDERLEMQDRGRAPEPSKPSLFPKVRDVGPHVPPSDEEMPARLESARHSVLSSNDPEKQLAWAQDTLIWVDNAQQDRIRIAEDEPTTLAASFAEDRLRTDALSIVNFLADQYHPKALFLRGTWYEFGKLGYPLNRKDAFDSYRAAVSKGYGRAEYRIGTQYEAMHDMGKAIKHYTGGETMGDSASNYRLGMMALLGQHGQQQDYYKGSQRIRYAAETADENAPQGAYVYGMLLARELPNITVPESLLGFDTDQARYYIEKAAFLGFAKAQLKMGSAYELCLLGCDFNPALSLHYNALAAHQGEADADMAISKWFLCGYEGIFDKNEELAFTYAKRAARAGLPTAEFALGYFYEIGMYVPCDLQQSKTWYQKAADHGSRDAMSRLESISRQDLLSRKDHEQVAITRIKSQYGSQRGKRPEHLRQKINPMPPTVEEKSEEKAEENADERVDMPDPKSTRSQRAGSRNSFMFITDHSDPPPRSESTAPYPIPEETNPPPRSKSTAPYPTEDPQPPPRSKSTAPYPDDEVPPNYGQRPPPGQRDQDMPNPHSRPMTGPPADRPLSAFGIRPANLQPQDQYGQGRHSYAQVRPASSMGNMAAVPEGRGSNPAGRNRIVSAGWEPQPAPSGYRQPNLQPMPLNLPPKPTNGNGRQQPYDNSYGGRDQRLAPNTSKPQPSLPPQRLGQDPGYPVTPVVRAAVPNSGYQVTPAAANPPQRGSQLPPAGHARLSSLPGPSRYDQPSNNASGHARLNSMPGQSRYDQPNKNSSGSNRLSPLPSQDARASLPSSTGQRFDSVQQGSQRPPFPHSSSQPPRASSAVASNSSMPPRASSAAPTTTSQPPRAASAAPNSVSPAASGKPMKEGPKTFDEMGIPAQKNESDCVVM